MTVSLLLAWLIHHYKYRWLNDYIIWTAITFVSIVLDTIYLLVVLNSTYGNVILF